MSTAAVNAPLMELLNEDETIISAKHMQLVLSYAISLKDRNPNGLDTEMLAREARVSIYVFFSSHS